MEYAGYQHGVLATGRLKGASAMSNTQKGKMERERVNLAHKSNGKNHLHSIDTDPAKSGESSLGKRLRALRRRVVNSGEVLLDWDGVANEVIERRGGVS